MGSSFVAEVHLERVTQCVEDVCAQQSFAPQQARLRHLTNPGRHGEAASLLAEPTCTTLSYMKTTSVTIRLDAKLQRELARLSRQLGRSRSEVIRDALRRQLALVQFEQIRRGLLPLAEAKGIVTDEDVFAIVS